ncbi:MAG: MBL fold metallo-hydrolase [Deltaproteobacteria bacterium]|jgi:phosphoribosyl 1,2-cyclic phosphodiesterase|nr:MBL fold metallo-hydrolase [Deltaproteobacteria bacterium]
MKVCVLASGSQANSIWVEHGATACVVDNGLSLKQFKLRVHEAKLNLKLLKAIFVTHDHSDHINGVGDLARHLGLKVYSGQVSREDFSCELERLDHSFITHQDTVTHGPLLIQAHKSSHDTLDPLVYTIRAENKSLGIATDLGCASEELLESFRNLDTLILEFNHDGEMLMYGTYPLFLKRRIHGDRGHLSNYQAAGILAKINHPKLKTVVLAHLSQHNNTPELAHNAALGAIKESDGNPHIFVASQDEPSPVFVI